MLQRKLAKNSKPRSEHLKKEIFNDATQLQVEAKMNQPHHGPEHDIEVFHDEVTFDELKNAILKSSNTKSFDIDGLHLTMIKILGTKALLFLLIIFNACWEYHVWPWTESRVVFIRKPNKERYYECFHIDHSQSPVISAKRWKGYLQPESNRISM